MLLFASCGQSNTIVSQAEDQDSIAIQTGAIDMSRQIASNPDNAELYYQRGLIYFDTKYLNRAEADLNTAIHLDSANALYYYAQARTQYAMFKTLNAAKYFELAIEKKPDFKEAKTKLADLYFFTKEHPKSINLTNSLLADDDNDYYAHYLKGMNYRDMGDTVKALSHFQKSIERNANDFNSYLISGILYTQLNNPIALDFLNGALRIRPNDASAFFARAGFFQKKKQYKMALYDYRKVIKLKPDNAECYYNVGYINFETGFVDEAIRNFDIGIQLDNNLVPAYYMRGLCHEMKGNRENAKRNYEYALKLNGNYTLASSGLERLNKKGK